MEDIVVNLLHITASYGPVCHSQQQLATMLNHRRIYVVHLTGYLHVVILKPSLCTLY